VSGSKTVGAGGAGGSGGGAGAFEQAAAVNAMSVAVAAAVQWRMREVYNDSMLRSLCLALTLLFAGVRAFAVVEIDTAGRIFEAAAVREQVRASLASMPKRIREMFAAQSSTQWTDAQLAAIGSAAEKGFRIDVFEPAALKAFADNIEPKAAEKTLQFLKSPLGLRMVTADRAIATLAEAQIDDILTGKIPQTTDAKRLAAIDQLERASHSAESTVEVFLTLGRAVAVGTAIGTGNDPVKVEAELLKDSESGRPQMVESMRESMRRYLNYGYRELSTGDLNHLTSFLQSRAGKAYVQAYTAALSKGYETMGKRCGEEIEDSLAEAGK
jgi:hypothetical protein